MVNDFALIFIMTEGGPVKATQVVPITVYRIALGQPVRTLVDQYQPAGFYQVP